jgi:hypothetical protein
MNNAEEETIIDKMVPQARLYALGYFLIFFSMLVIMVYKKQFSLMTVSFVIINVVVFFLSVYVINCSVAGQCHLYAWIMAYAIIVFSIIATINSIYLISKN